MEVMVSLSFSSKYCQLIHINRPHCCKFLLNEHQPPCLSFPSSLIYFLLMPQSALPSQSSFPCACDARIWLHRFHTFSTVPVLADLPPPSLPITQFGSSTSPGKLCECITPTYRNHDRDSRHGQDCLSLSCRVPDATSTWQGATLGGQWDISICLVQCDCAVQLMSCSTVGASLCWVDAALSGPSFTWSSLAKAAKSKYLT